MIGVVGVIRKGFTLILQTTAFISLLPHGARHIAQAVVELIEEDKVPLPLLSESASRTIAVTTNPDATFAEYDAAIRTDPSLTMRLLQAANSPVYGVARSISSIRQAMVILGVNKLRKVLQQVVFEANLFRGRESPQLANERTHAVAVAHIADEIASRCQGGSADAFLCGMLHDYGRIMWPQLVPLLPPGHDPDELSISGELLHTQLGAYAVTKWSLPAKVSEAASRHHAFAKNEESEHSKIGQIIAAAELVAHVFGLGNEMQGDPENWADHPIWEQLGVRSVELPAVGMQAEQVRRVYGPVHPQTPA